MDGKARIAPQPGPGTPWSGGAGAECLLPARGAAVERCLEGVSVQPRTVSYAPASTRRDYEASGGVSTPVPRADIRCVGPRFLVDVPPAAKVTSTPAAATHWV